MYHSKMERSWLPVCWSVDESQLINKCLVVGATRDSIANDQASDENVRIVSDENDPRSFLFCHVRRYYGDDDYLPVATTDHPSSESFCVTDHYLPAAIYRSRIRNKHQSFLQRFFFFFNDDCCRWLLRQAFSAFSLRVVLL